MNAMFPEGITLTFINTSPVRVRRFLGGGGQGEVFEVEFAGELMAMKWYYPSCLRSDPGLPERLRVAIRNASPSASFLWPIVVLESSQESQCEQRIPEGTFGYMMKLRPPEYQGAIEHIAGRTEISLRDLLQACFHLVEAFHALHSKGLCYKDISLGNLFLDPASGRILICDIDNVDVNGKELGGVKGTPGFMAPEVLLGRSSPSASSDLFSMAVLLFRLLTRHDPYLGSMELQIRCLDEPAKRRLYGEDPVFIFDEHDARNRPDPSAHPAPLVTWPIYPAQLKTLFQQSLAAGAKDPFRRAFPGQWMKALARCLDQRSLCPHCGQEVFPEPGESARCWACGGEVPPAPRLLTPCAPVVARPGNELYGHHFDSLAPDNLSQPIGRVETHPNRPDILGVKNLTPHAWRADLSSGDTTQIPPGRSCNLASLAALHTHLGTVRLAS